MGGSPSIGQEADLPGLNPEWRTRNIGRLLLCAADMFVTDKLADFNDSGFGPVSQVHVSLIQNLDLRGTRLSTIAARARVTKQTMLELVDRAEASGLVARRPDGEDRRAKAVVFTPRGLEMMDRLRNGIGRAERRMARIVGAAFLRRTKQELTAYAGASGGMPGGLKGETEDVAWRSRNIGRVMRAAFDVFTRDVQRTLHANGFAAVSEVHMTLFRNLDVDGTRPTELAARARMTKQAMTDLVRRTELLGLVRQVPDARDGRAKTVVLTPEGCRLFDQTRAGLDEAERRMAAMVGTEFFAELKQRLAVYVAGSEASYLATDIGALALTGKARSPALTVDQSDGSCTTSWGDVGRSPPSSRIKRAG